VSRFGARTVTVTVVALLVSACSGDVPLQASTPPSTENVCGAAKPGTQAVVYSAPGLEYWYSDVLTTFEQDCGVSIYYGSFSGPEVLQRLGDERSAPLSDIVIAQPPYITQAADEGLLDSTAVPGASSVPAERCDAQRRWCTMVESYTSWVYRKTGTSSPPVTWSEMLAPAYAGQILTSRPDQTVDGFAALELLTQTEGASAAIAYLTQLEASVSAHYTNTDTISRLVSAGVALVGNGNLQENLNDLDQFHNIGIWFPRATGQTPSTLAVPYGAALVKGGPNRATATALLTYLWSRAGQLAVGGANVAPGRPDVVPSDSRSKRLRSILGTTHVIRVDWEQVVVQQPQLLARWTAIARAPDGTAAPSSPTPTAALPPPPPAASPSPSH
jgi:ABC-type Fe3+ transport system substrate-binding protein